MFRALIVGGLLATTVPGAVSAAPNRDTSGRAQCPPSFDMQRISHGDVEDRNGDGVVCVKLLPGHNRQTIDNTIPAWAQIPD